MFSTLKFQLHNHFNIRNSDIKEHKDKITLSVQMTQGTSEA